MQLSVGRGDLASLLNWARAGVDHGSKMEVMRNLLLRAESDRLSVLASNLTTYLLGEIPAQVDHPGAVLAPARKLAEIAKEAAGERVTLALDGPQLRLSLDHGTYKLATREAEDFPSAPSLAEPARLRWDAEALRYALETVAISASGSDARFNLNGALLGPHPGGAGGVRLVSTDGHRLTLLDRSPAGGESLPKTPQVIIPLDGMAMICSMLKKPGEVAMEVGKGLLAVERQGRRVTVRLVEGRFPDYDVVIPKKPTIRALMPREALRAALRRAQIMTDHEFKPVKLEFGPDRLHVRGQAAELGEADEVLDTSCDGTVSLGLNSRYLLETCECMLSEQITMAITDPRNPVAISGEGDQGFQAVIMPIT